MNSKILDFDWMEINIQLILSKFTTPCIQRGHHKISLLENEPSVQTKSTTCCFTRY